MLKIVMLLCLLSTTSFATEKNVKKVIYYMPGDSASPLMIPDGNNLENAGIISEVINLLNFNDFQLTIENLPFSRMIQSMSKSKSAWISAGSTAWGGPQSQSVSKTVILHVKHGLLSLNNFKYEKIEDLFGKRIVLIRGFDYPGLNTYINTGLIEVTYVNNQESAIQSILEKRAIAFPEMQSRIKYNLKKYNIDKTKLKITDVSEIIKGYNINICFSPNFPKKLKNSLELQLANLKKSGKIENSIQKYLE